MEQPNPPPIAGRPAREPDATVVAFEHVSLAFDEKVILKDVSFSLKSGHTKIILGASGAGKSISLKILLGLLKADAGEVWVNGQRIDQLAEHEMMATRADVGMVFQEGALFDSLTVRENVGYRLYEETRMPLEEVDRRVQEVLGWVGLSEFTDRMPSELSGGQRRRVAIARAMTSKPKILLYDAFYVATKTAIREKNGDVRIVTADQQKEQETEFLMLRDGLIVFEGDAKALRSSDDEYLKKFLS